MACEDLTAAARLDSETSPTPNETLCLDVQRSVTGRRWIMRPCDDALAGALSRTLGAPDALGRLLAARGVTPETAKSFLSPALRDSFPDPSSFADMDAAVRLAWDVVEAKRGIAVFADYDVDGASSAAQLIRYFRMIGAEIGLYVPDRVTEGYGPSAAAFRALKARGASLVFTVDCGAAAHAALDAAHGDALDIIVLDHHLMSGERPHAAALVNPNRADCQSGQGHLAAAGVAFVFLAAMNREGRRRGAFGDQRPEPDLLGLLELAALGTICDMVPLRGFNRAIAAQGLKLMGLRRNPGVAALAAVAQHERGFDTQAVGFVLGPRINAGGRVGRSDLGARLLATDDPDEAATLAQELDGLNVKRREVEAEIVEQAAGQAERLIRASDASIVVVGAEGWHPGVVGIVAARLVERFGRPAIVIGWGAGDTHARGSGRSVPGVNLGNAIATAAREGLLAAGGGHAMAAGLTIEIGAIDAFRAWIANALRDARAAADEARSLDIDALVGVAGLTADLVEMWERAGPFGQGHPEPLVAIAGARVAYAEALRGGHVRVSLEDSAGRRASAIAFRAEETPLGIALLTARDSRVHVVGRLKRNEYQGRVRADLHIVDLAPA
jgi:single-stranded-DNA-specific exonuclease